MLDAASSSGLRWDWGVQEPSGFHKLEIGDSPEPFLIRVTLPVCCGEL